MKLVIFGSTGSVGRHIVAQARDAGHVVTGFSRRDNAGDAAARPDRLVRGDVLDPFAVLEAVAGQDAVLVAVGAGRKGGVRARGTANVIAAMRHHGIRRLVCQSTLGAGESVGNLNFYWKYVMFGALLRPAFKDHQEQEALVRASGLDWTIVRPAAFTDGPIGGAYVHGFAPDVRDLTFDISRADVARFMLEQADNRGYLHSTPGLSYAKAA
jgi:uncharacterized protein YbjT (DUF2867 family)